MKKTVCFVAILLAIVPGFGCRTWGTVEDYRWTIKAPAKVQKPIRENSQIVFQVESHLVTGEPVESISFYYVIQWVGLQGWDHKGKTFQDQSIRVKGSAGTAYIKIYAYDKDDRLIEVARQDFEVEIP